MSDLRPIIGSVLGVLLVMGVGALCRRRDWLTRQSDRSLANLTASVFLPAYFVNRILTSEQFDSIAGVWVAPTIGFTSTAIGFAIAFLFARSVGKFIGLDNENKQRAFALCVGICNYGYIPLPLAEKFYPEVVIELIMHNVGVDLALWSVGIAIVGSSIGGSWKRVLLSPPLLAVIFATLFRQSGWSTMLPGPILTAIGTMGNCAIPMGLLLSGAIIVDFVKDTDWSGSLGVIVAAIGIRQLLMPVMMLAVTAQLDLSSDMLHVMMLQAAMPVAVFPIVLVRLYERETSTALSVILSSSLAGVVLIPIWLAIGKWWLGI